MLPSLKIIIRNLITYMNIPIVLSSDNDYAPYMYVVVFSVLKNKNASTSYQFYFLVTSNFQQEYKKKLSILCEKHNCQARFIDMKDAFVHAKQWNYFTTPVYYRLSIENILSEEKCIYLDCDTLVLNDLSELFEIDIDDFYAAGILDILNINKPKYLYKLNICKPLGYINTGVILLNLKNLRRNVISKSINHILTNKTFQKLSKFPDQDTLNKAYSGHIKIIPLKFNFFSNFFSESSCELHTLDKIYPKEEYLNNLPIIVHFAGKEKPWYLFLEKKEHFDKIWLEYAQQTELYDEILLKAFKHDLIHVIKTYKHRYKLQYTYLKYKLLSYFYPKTKKQYYQKKSAKLYEQLNMIKKLVKLTS